MDFEEGELLSVELEEGELEQSQTEFYKLVGKHGLAYSKNGVIETSKILENSFFCDKCPAQFKSKEILSGHKFTFHGVGMKI